ncbi:hypothetical protein P170DRAFT_474821 [Aspergillus steynii IBT 23096]|uniref:HNH nuclease domain-containing protein n=1 Tax=Aspergillus steynii IBT 23096 TaxID=1392250 RepID=A0A2I2GEF3_9EURO|nr:uncharacterized protein P170DRAFT_474821 [Aspergillus steynii IBT 23096]PLB51276.1 hypothetical protein P170DRAFT_474821 [Aspergillus steynii IBT 23096]
MPDKHASAPLSDDHRPDLEKLEKRNSSNGSQMSNMIASSVSNLIAGKIAQLESERDTLVAHRDTLLEAKKKQTVDPDELQAKLDNTIARITPICEILKILRKQRHQLEQDIAEAQEMKSNTRLHENESAHSIVSRLMQSPDKEPTLSLSDEVEFRRDVLARYAAITREGAMVYCHLSGWNLPNKIREVPLVPMSLAGRELAFLFGSDEMPPMDARNGISLHFTIQSALDAGVIAIVPEISGSECKWKCVLVDRSKENEIALEKVFLSTDGLGQPLRIPEREYKLKKGNRVVFRWKDLDNQELVFHTEARPAHRYLFFRFIMTYMQAKKGGHTDFTSAVENTPDFWASSGPYLDRATLKEFVRNISGLELPPSLMKNTFTDKDCAFHPEAEDVAATLSIQIKDAHAERMRDYDKPDKSDEDEEDSDDRDADAESSDDELDYWPDS